MILYLHKSHNTPPLPPINLQMHCFGFLLGHLHVPGEIANNDYANFFGEKRCVMGFVQVENLDKMQSFFEVLKTFKFAAILVHHLHQSSLGLEEL